MGCTCAEDGRKCLSTNPNGYRKKGRPQTRWSDIISHDDRAIGVPIWRTSAKSMIKRNLNEGSSSQKIYVELAEEVVRKFSATPGKREFEYGRKEC
uniref:Uncharacterized protein n=1 Tax=Megaselia scalaris TaxID=36166 RepID=T1GB66_MEGSC